jgi:hypothetical protein
MRVRWEIWLAAVALCFATPALAASSTPYAKGGRTKDFAVDVQKQDQSGEQFRITGHCQSACTMFLAVRNVCVEPSARLQRDRHEPHDEFLQFETARLSRCQSCDGNPGVPHDIGQRYDQ